MSETGLKTQEEAPAEGDARPALTDEERASLKADADNKVATGEIDWTEHARLVATDFGRSVTEAAMQPASLDAAPSLTPKSGAHIPDRILKAYNAPAVGAEAPDITKWQDSGTSR